MSCCGSRRAVQRPQQVAAPPRSRPGTPTNPTVFEYSGPGAIAVLGPLTGTTYRFAGNGTRLVVHAADAPSLAAVRGLKPIR
jgi:hypothetical protein